MLSEIAAHKVLPIKVVLCAACAVALGVLSASAYGVYIGVGLIALLPLASHARHVGVRNMLSEPNTITVIVGFYLFIFPLRGLVVALSGFTDVLHNRQVVTGGEVVSVLLLASVATTVLVESYYFACPNPSRRPPIATEPAERHAAVVRLATLLIMITLVGLAGVLATYGGISGARAQFLTHTVTSALEGEANLAGSIWENFAVPTVWCCAYIVFNKGSSKAAKLAYATSALTIIAAALVIYGSRLDTLLGLIGVWVIYFYSGRRIPARVILLAFPIAVLLSLPILSERQSQNTKRSVYVPHTSTIERLSQVSSYDVLDVSLAIHSEPAQIRAQLTEPKRWLDLPGYFVPAVLWHSRPNLASRRLGLYTAQDFGTVNDQATGFPTTYITEGWLIGGWPGTIILSIMFGLAIGWAVRRLTRDSPPSPAMVLSLAFVVTLGWTYYKDGDLLSLIVGHVRQAVYLMILLWITGLIGHRRKRV
jgi:hypothetical protein